jgi:hypothetical protein
MIEINVYRGTTRVGSAEAEDAESALLAARTLFADDQAIWAWRGRDYRFVFKCDGELLRVSNYTEIVGARS